MSAETGNGGSGPAGMPLSVEVPMSVIAYDDPAAKPGLRPLAVEAPVNLIYGSVPHAVMMTTPGDLEDFAYGFSLTEGIIEEAAEVREVRVEAAPDGLRLLVELAPGRLREHLARKRAISGRTGCGVCGIEDLASLPHAVPRTAPSLRLPVESVGRALSALDSEQRLGARTRAVHAAAWARLDGTLTAVREDVGRHNALDKLIGALIRAGTDPADGFLVITSRCSFEMVEKAVRLGAGAVVAISAPTSLALERAKAHGLTLCAIARSDSLTVFTGGERLVHGGA
ncbi:formate dehydrogenase accessory sulfurtransferase FdhD [Methylobacterium sp. J-076]|uniref:formate dehydrogenase accessory sulfurtransferase FdhD n=1 Tax=Methylobacterium sp. J-076 TaxID=2836655 RepID=UPI001FB95191|nr:formate dehydrogenase accessory sulfurtransferase FdhD [Methylobacterium sp. J-076]MCJ2015454.1 formate dehydrogenase accessory sulfurtransferase FdhD [Methylobacterium sp. J-076]